MLRASATGGSSVRTTKLAPTLPGRRSASGSGRMLNPNRLTAQERNAIDAYGDADDDSEEPVDIANSQFFTGMQQSVHMSSGSTSSAAAAAAAAAANPTASQSASSSRVAYERRNGPRPTMARHDSATSNGVSPARAAALRAAKLGYDNADETDEEYEEQREPEPEDRAPRTRQSSRVDLERQRREEEEIAELQRSQRRGASTDTVDAARAASTPVDRKERDRLQRAYANGSAARAAAGTSSSASAAAAAVPAPIPLAAAVPLGSDEKFSSYNAPPPRPTAMHPVQRAATAPPSAAAPSRVRAFFTRVASIFRRNSSGNATAARTTSTSSSSATGVAAASSGAGSGKRASSKRTPVYDEREFEGAADEDEQERVERDARERLERIRAAADPTVAAIMKKSQKQQKRLAAATGMDPVSPPPPPPPAPPSVAASGSVSGAERRTMGESYRRKRTGGFAAPAPVVASASTRAASGTASSRSLGAHSGNGGGGGAVATASRARPALRYDSDSDSDSEDNSERAPPLPAWKNGAAAAAPAARVHRSISLEPQKFENGRIRGVVGLVNLGNTCFMNSCLQCLCSTPPLLAYFSSSEYREHINTRSPCGGRLAAAFGQLVNGVRFGANNDVLRPADLKRVVASIAPRFSGYQQHDAQEFLQCLLDGLHDDLNRVTRKPAYQAIPDVAGENDAAASERWWRNYTERNNSFISDLFCGQLKSTVQCTACRHTSTAFDPIWDISVPIPSGRSRARGPLTLYDCFEAYTQRELLQGNEQYYCSRCKKHQDSYKQLCVFRYPHVLVVHLKRFSTTMSRVWGAQRSKLTTEVKFPLYGFDLSEFAVHDDGRPHVVYDLFAVANHMGSLSGGHYTAYGKVADHQWALFNDSHATRVEESQVCGPEAYVLFYRRREA